MSSTDPSGRTVIAESPSNLQLIVDALADYATQTGIDLSHHPLAERLQLSIAPNDILELLHEREKAFIKYREGNWLNRTLIEGFSPAIRVLNAFSGTLGEAVGLLPFPPAKAIFVGIDVLLAAASEVSASYDALLDLFECLGNFLKRLDIYTSIPPTQIMTDIIVQIMVELLSVLALATKQIKRGRLRTFARKLLGDSEVEVVLKRLDRLTQDEARTTGAQTLRVVYSLVSNLKVDMEDGKASSEDIRQALVSLHQVIYEINKMKRDQFQRDVQHWLSPPDPSTNHDFVCEARHEGTAAWIFESDVFSSWKSTGSLLWVHGKPGSGKTTLLSAIIQDIEGLRAAGLATIAYYYCDFRDVKKQDRYGILSSLLSQLSAESDICREVLSQLYATHSGGARKPTSNALTNCMKDMLSSPDQGEIYIIIDAIDECPNTSGILSAREKVLELVERLACLKLPNVHICVTSRPEVDIRSVLGPLTSLEISLHEERGQKDDIINYIKSFVHSDRNMRKWREEDKRFVISELSEKADGMFRYVVCQVDRLRRSFPASIRSILDDLPKSLDETYSRTLMGIDEEKREYAQRLFQCLIVAIRPLRIEELAETFAVRLDEAVPTFNPDWRPVDTNEAVLSSCSSLISVVNAAGSLIVQFSHFSVKEFLTSDRLAKAEWPLSCYHILPEHAHTTLARASLSILLHLDDRIDRDTVRHLPLALYAAQHWVDHARFGNVSSQIQDLMMCLFDPSKPHFIAWLWLYNFDHHWLGPMYETHPTRPSAVPLYYASSCGLRGLVEHLVVAHPQDINTRGGAFGTPLHVASAKGHFEIVQLLLDNNADPYLCNDEGMAPLHSASHYGHVEAVKTLLNHGVDINQTDSRGYTPLHFASEDGRLEVSRLLMQRGAFVDACGYDQVTPLHEAVAGGILEIVHLLLESGASVNLTDAAGWTPLHKAAFCGYHDIAELLLGSSASLDSRANAQETPLIVACRHERFEVSRILLDYGADVNSCDANGWAPLHFVSCYGFLDVMRLLLDQGADTDPPQANPLSPMHNASTKGHPQVTKLLIQHGANIDIRNGREETPLHNASKYGHLEVSRILVEYGANVSSRDDEGWTPLHKASIYGHLPVTKFLLECGINIDTQNEDGKTALDLASGGGKVDIVHFLIEEGGANIHTRDKYGLTPLHVASQNGHFDVVRLFLVDKSNKTATELASANDNVDVASFLARYKADANVRNYIRLATLEVPQRHETRPISLHKASKDGDIDGVKSLLDQGADINALNANHETSLHVAVNNHDLELMKLLLDRGAEVDARDKLGWTPLLYASRGDVKASRMLIEHGANVNARNFDYSAPIHLSAHNGYPEIVQLLLERGVDIHASNNDGLTGYQVSLRQGHRKVADLLRDHGMRGA